MTSLVRSGKLGVGKDTGMQDFLMENVIMTTGRENMDMIEMDTD